MTSVIGMAFLMGLADAIVKRIFAISKHKEEAFYVSVGNVGTYLASVVGYNLQLADPSNLYNVTALSLARATVAMGIVILGNIGVHYLWRDSNSLTSPAPEPQVEPEAAPGEVKEEPVK